MSIPATTASELAKALKVSRMTIHKRAKRLGIPMVAGRRLFTPEEVEQITNLQPLRPGRPRTKTAKGTD